MPVRADVAAIREAARRMARFAAEAEALPEDAVRACRSAAEANAGFMCAEGARDFAEDLSLDMGELKAHWEDTGEVLADVADNWERADRAAAGEFDAIAAAHADPEAAEQEVPQTLPTFQQCLDAGPAELRALGEAVATATERLTGIGDAYAATVGDLADSWQGNDYKRLIDWSGHVAAFIGRSDDAMAACAAALRDASAALTAALDALKTAERDAERLGFTVLPVPLVGVGPDQWRRIAAAGPSAPALLGAHRIAAAALTAELAAHYTAAVARDAVCFALIRAALVLEPGHRSRWPGESEAAQGLEDASTEELLRVFDQVTIALEAADVAWFDTLDPPVSAAAFVEIDDLDNGRGVYLTWHLGRAEGRGDDLTALGADLQRGFDRIEAALDAAGIRTREKDDDMNPFTIEVLSAP